MAQGLEVYNENGKLILGTSNRLGFFLGRVTLTANQSSLTFDNIIFTKNTPFYIIYTDSPTDPKYLVNPVESVVGSRYTLTWTANSRLTNAQVLIGAY